MSDDEDLGFQAKSGKLAAPDSRPRSGSGKDEKISFFGKLRGKTKTVKETKESSKETPTNDSEVDDYIAKALSREEKEPKERHMRAIVINTWRVKSCQPFFKELNKIKETKTVPLVGYKALSIIYRILHDGYPTSLQEFYAQTAYIEELGKEAAKKHDKYSQVCSTLSQFLLLKLRFHHSHPSFAGSLMDEVSFNESQTTELLPLMREFMELLQTILIMQSLVFGSKTTSVVDCFIIPIIPLVEEAICIYDKMVYIMFVLAQSLTKNALDLDQKRLEDLHRKLKQFFEQIKRMPTLSGKIKLPELLDAPVLQPAPKREKTNTYDADLIDVFSSSILPPMTGQLIDFDTKGMSQTELSDEIKRLRHQLDVNRTLISSLQAKLRLDIDENHPEAIRRLHELATTKGNEALMEAVEIIDNYESQNIDLQAELDVAKAMISSLNVIKHDDDALIKELRNEVGLQQEQITSLQQQHNEQQQLKLNEVQKAMTTASQTLQKELENQIANLELELQIQRSDGNALKLLTATQKHELEKYKTEVDALTTENSNFKSKLGEANNKLIETMKESHSSYQKVNELQDLISKYETQLQQATDVGDQEAKVIDEVQLQLIEAQTNIRRAEEAAALKIVQTEQRINVLENELNLTKEQYQIALQNAQKFDLEAKQANVKLELIASEKENATQQKESIVAAASRQLLQRREFLIHSAIQQAKEKIIKGINASDDTEHLILSNGNVEKLVEELQSHVNTLTSTFQSMAENDADDSIPIIAITIPNQFVSSLLSVEQLTKALTIQESAPQSPNETIVICNNSAISFLDSLNTIFTIPSKDFGENVTKSKEEMSHGLEQFLVIAREISKLANQRGDVLEQQMNEASEVVENASNRIEMLLARARAEMSETQLIVSEAILGCSMNLMNAIKILIERATLVQREIVALETGAGKRTASQFYKRHSRWVDGLISAAKAVGASAGVVVEIADGVVRGENKFEQLMVAGHEIAASTAQLVSASRVKAPSSSVHALPLEDASRAVSASTKALIEAARKAGLVTRKTQSATDYLKLSLTQAKRLEMDSQVRVLELEGELSRERERLGQLRRAHYHLAADSEEKVSTA